MYDVYLGRLLLPVTPQKIDMRIGGKNQTVTLINEGEINILKAAGLTEISFTALLPQVKYPFARYEAGAFAPASAYLEYLETLKTAQAPFQFIVSRWMPDGLRLFDTDMAVSLEEYSISEDAKNGFDLNVDIRLKQFRPYGTKTIEIGVEIPDAPVAMEEQRPITTNPEKSSGSSGGSKKTSSKKKAATTVKEKVESKIASVEPKAILDKVSAAVGRTSTGIKRVGMASSIPGLSSQLIVKSRR